MILDAVAFLELTDCGLAAVTLQVPASSAPLSFRRNVASRAIVALEGVGIWLAELAGRAWDEHTLRELVEAIAAPVNPTTDRRTPTQRAQDLFGLTGVVVRRPTLHDFGIQSWPTRTIAVAMILSGIDASRPTPLDVDVMEVKRQLDNHLADALAAFNRRLNSAPFDLAVQHPQMAAVVYGYLSDPDHGKYRLQFARALPLLLPSVASDDAVGPFLRFRAAIDRGDPLIRTGAAIFSVAPATLRGLVGQDPQSLGSRWLSNPAMLLGLLDTIWPEARPGRGDCGWERLNGLVQACEEATCLRLDESFFVRAWVRAEMHRAFSGGGAEVAPTQSMREVSAIDRFMQGLVALLQVELGGHFAGIDARTVELSRVVDRRLMSYGLKAIGRMAITWQERLDGERAADRDLLTFVRSRGDRYWPLLQSQYSSVDGTRLVVPLVTADELVQHGNALGICLGSSMAHAYISACKRGRTFILGLRELKTGRPMSTAEVRLVRQAGAVPLDPVVVQHTGLGNAQPTKECHAALCQALKSATTSQGQAHLRLGMAALRSFRGSTTASLNQIEALASLRAFRVVLGKSPVDTLFRSAHAVAPNAPFGGLAPLESVQRATRET